MEVHEVEAEDIRWRLWREDRCWSLEAGGVTVRLLAECCCGRGRPLSAGEAELRIEDLYWFFPFSFFLFPFGFRWLACPDEDFIGHTALGNAASRELLRDDAAGD
jgi:hypothetical protein